ncbi:MAG TPA: M23 family metallopeptidase [Solirubrobacter sp.]|nr:M23 family metallopeptidase [Solirubrobacter sp.]
MLTAHPPPTPPTTAAPRPPITRAAPAPPGAASLAAHAAATSVGGAPRLVPPVRGPVARAFSYSRAEPFAAGRHRGADVAAAAGTRVRAACTGVVAWARGDIVVVACGGWRVTHLPLATISARRGARVAAGAPIGTLARDPLRGGLHLGVRAASDRFTYIDPVPLLRSAPRPFPLTPAPRTIPERRLRAPRPIRPRLPAPHLAPHPLRPRAASPRPPPRVAAPARVRVLAPWPAWLGLAVLLVGAAGGGVRVGLRRRRGANGAAVAWRA